MERRVTGKESKMKTAALLPSESLSRLRPRSQMWSRVTMTRLCSGPEWLLCLRQGGGGHGKQGRIRCCRHRRHQPHRYSSATRSRRYRSEAEASTEERRGVGDETPLIKPVEKARRAAVVRWCAGLSRGIISVMEI